jgi:hypothetical protein
LKQAYIQHQKYSTASTVFYHIFSATKPGALSKTTRVLYPIGRQRYSRCFSYAAENFRLFSYARDRGYIVLFCSGYPVLTVLFCLSCPNRPILTDLSFLTALSWPISWMYGLTWMMYSMYCIRAVVLLSHPVLTVVSWLSYPSCPFLAILSWLFCVACSVLAVLSWLSYYGCPVLVVLFWLSCPDCPGLTVLFWLFCCDCPGFLTEFRRCRISEKSSINIRYTVMSDSLLYSPMFEFPIYRVQSDIHSLSRTSD